MINRFVLEKYELYCRIQSFSRKLLITHAGAEPNDRV